MQIARDLHGATLEGPPMLIPGMPPPDFLKNLPKGCCTPLFGMPVPPIILVSIRAKNGNYLAHDNKKTTNVIQSNAPDKWEIRFLSDKPGCITLKNVVTNKYFTAEKILGITGSVSLDRDEAHFWEEWHFEYGKPGYFYAKSHHGKFLSFDTSNKVNADAKHVGDPETFSFIAPEDSD